MFGKTRSSSLCLKCNHDCANRNMHFFYMCLDAYYNINPIKMIKSAYIG